VRDRLWRDASGRLTFDATCVDSTDYPDVSHAIADAFGLSPEGSLVIGPEQIFWDFRRGEHIVSLDWDIWMQFMVVAKSAASEPLVREIAAWLDSSPWSRAGKKP
jgi:hypothetical protein